MGRSPTISSAQKKGGQVVMFGPPYPEFTDTPTWTTEKHYQPKILEDAIDALIRVSDDPLFGALSEETRGPVLKTIKSYSQYLNN